MKWSTLRAASVVGIAMTFAACSGKPKDEASFKASVDSMTPHLDSTKAALDSSKKGAAIGAQVDTTKLGAAKTESILSKARKSP
ncbi:MAG TPA: hypothetical protein VH080_06530 [Gemmatimonadaceae bacterium]|nr:hypothetical protein [Gemmatimonadaceae bacterium]